MPAEVETAGGNCPAKKKKKKEKKAMKAAAEPEEKVEEQKVEEPAATEEKPVAEKDNKDAPLRHDSTVPTGYLGSVDRFVAELGDFYAGPLAEVFLDAVPHEEAYRSDVVGGSTSTKSLSTQAQHLSAELARFGASYPERESFCCALCLTGCQERFLRGELTYFLKEQIKALPSSSPASDAFGGYKSNCGSTTFGRDSRMWRDRVYSATIDRAETVRRRSADDRDNRLHLYSPRGLSSFCQEQDGLSEVFDRDQRAAVRLKQQHARTPNSVSALANYCLKKRRSDHILGVSIPYPVNEPLKNFQKHALVAVRSDLLGGVWVPFVVAASNSFDRDGSADTPLKLQLYGGDACFAQLTKLGLQRLYNNRYDRHLVRGGECTAPNPPRLRTLFEAGTGQAHLETSWKREFSSGDFWLTTLGFEAHDPTELNQSDPSETRHGYLYYQLKEHLRSLPRLELVVLGDSLGLARSFLSGRLLRWQQRNQLALKQRMPDSDAWETLRQTLTGGPGGSGGTGSGKVELEASRAVEEKKKVETAASSTANKTANSSSATTKCKNAGSSASSSSSSGAGRNSDGTSGSSSSFLEAVRPVDHDEPLGSIETVDEKVEALRRFLFHTATPFEHFAPEPDTFYWKEKFSKRLQKKDGLNQSQTNAVVGSLTHRGVTCVIGPPGTGKTNAVAGMVNMLVSVLRVLIKTQMERIAAEVLGSSSCTRGSRGEIKEWNSNDDAAKKPTEAAFWASKGQDLARHNNAAAEGEQKACSGVFNADVLSPAGVVMGRKIREKLQAPSMRTRVVCTAASNKAVANMLETYLSRYDPCDNNNEYEYQTSSSQVQQPGQDEDESERSGGGGVGGGGVPDADLRIVYVGVEDKTPQRIKETRFWVHTRAERALASKSEWLRLCKDAPTWMAHVLGSKAANGERGWRFEDYCELKPRTEELLEKELIVGADVLFATLAVLSRRKVLAWLVDGVEDVLANGDGEALKGVPIDVHGSIRGGFADGGSSSSAPEGAEVLLEARSELKADIAVGRKRRVLAEGMPTAAKKRRKSLPAAGLKSGSPDAGVAGGTAAGGQETAPAEQTTGEPCGSIVFPAIASRTERDPRVFRRRPTVVIVDEAGQALEAETQFLLLFSPTKLILVGDCKQLSATVVHNPACRRFGYSRSLFARLVYGQDRRINLPQYNTRNALHNRGCQVKMLTTQYRMHPEIADFVNRSFYDGKLQTIHAPQLRAAVLSSLAWWSGGGRGDEESNLKNSNYWAACARKAQTFAQLLAQKPYIVIDHKFAESSSSHQMKQGGICNWDEAVALSNVYWWVTESLAVLSRRATEAYRGLVDARARPRNFAQEAVTVLTFYNGQREQMWKHRHTLFRPPSTDEDCYYAPPPATGDKKAQGKPQVKPKNRSSSASSSSSDFSTLGSPYSSTPGSADSVYPEIHTVDSFQGSESEVVLLSLVRSSSQHGFLSDFRRLNVALSRAKELLVVFANVEGLLEKPKLDDQFRRDAVVQGGRGGVFLDTVEKRKNTPNAIAQSDIEYFERAVVKKHAAAVLEHKKSTVTAFLEDAKKRGLVVSWEGMSSCGEQFGTSPGCFGLKETALKELGAVPPKIGPSKFSNFLE